MYLCHMDGFRVQVKHTGFEDFLKHELSHNLGFLNFLKKILTTFYRGTDKENTNIYCVQYNIKTYNKGLRVAFQKNCIYFMTTC